MSVLYVRRKTPLNGIVAAIEMRRDLDIRPSLGREFEDQIFVDVKLRSCHGTVVKDILCGMYSQSLTQENFS